MVQRYWESSQVRDIEIGCQGILGRRSGHGQVYLCLLSWFEHRCPGFRAYSDISIGGGFSLDGDDTHIRFWNDVGTDVKASDVTIAFLFLEYTLVPHATYPKPIYEAVESVKYVLEELHRPASQIMLAGDSAGGNMCLGVLSHLMHPSPEFPEIKLAEEDKLKAIVGIAPWVSFDTSKPSVAKNEYKDIINPVIGTKWSTDYLAGKSTTPYSEALTAPAEWWKNSKVENMLVVAGANEILVSAIDEWVTKYKVPITFCPILTLYLPLIIYSVGEPGRDHLHGRSQRSSYRSHHLLAVQ